MAADRYKSWTAEELSYLCKFYDHDGTSHLGYALDRTPKSVTQQAIILRRKTFVG